MCGRYRLNGGIDILQQIESTIGVPVVKVSDAASQVLAQDKVYRAYQDVPVLQAGARGKVWISLMYWQLIHFWNRTFESRYTNFNTRVESLEKKHNAELLRRYRCLLPATCFFETRKDEAGRAFKPREAYEFSLDQGAVMMLGGIYSIWRNPEDPTDERASCSVITVEPSQIVRDVHPRMPFVVPAGSCSRWLHPESTDVDEMLALVQPFASNQLVRRQEV